MRFKWILLLTLVVASVAEARPRRFSPVMYSSPAVTMPVYQYPAFSPVVMPQPVAPQAIMPQVIGPVVPQAYVPQPAMGVPMSATGGGLAQSKAQIQARAGRCFHPGGSFGAGTHEGCGFSSVSPDDAVRRCCYWGQRTPIDIGVAQGPNGWYATVIYQ